MIECMKTLNEFYIMDIEINSITCDDNEKKRKERLNYFSLLIIYLEKNEMPFFGGFFTIKIHALDPDPYPDPL